MSYLLIFIVLLLAELVYFRIAGRFNIVDRPDRRSSHKQITLRGGGVVFYLAVLAYSLMCGFPYPWFFIGLTLIAFTGFADDVKPQPASFRLIVHFIGMSMVFLQWDLLELPWYYTLAALVFCAGILNAWNFMDGINGITGGYSTVTVASLWYINTYRIAFTDNGMLYVLLIALAIYNFFNFRTKAKCFAGDVGAMSIAFCIVFMLGRLVLRTGDFSYIVLLALYGIDSVLTIAHRLMRRENIFTAHRSHVYQIMANELKIPHVWVAVFYLLLQVVINAGYLSVPADYRWHYALLCLAALSIAYILFLKKFFRLHIV